MKQILEISYAHYDSLEELGKEDYALVKEAEEATKNANAAYSKFHVGAAVRLQSGRTLHASNFESEVYPAGLCAERSLSDRYQNKYIYFSWHFRFLCAKTGRIKKPKEIII